MNSLKKIIQLGNSVRDKKQIFVIIKPEYLKYQQKIVDIFIKNGWSIDKLRTKQLLPSEAQGIYRVHRGESFYKDLCKYMTSGPSVGILFTKRGNSSDTTFGSIQKIKNEIRSKWSIDDMKNVIHSSDSPEAVSLESSIYFE